VKGNLQLATLSEAQRVKNVEFNSTYDSLLKNIRE
jgi:hypothetical protein